MGTPIELREIDSIISVVSNGVMITAARVETVVRLTERAILLLAIKQTTLDAVPPGQQATKTIPMT
jgi:hypothetical protein